jgi:hypothetical protein
MLNSRDNKYTGKYYIMDLEITNQNIEITTFVEKYGHIPLEEMMYQLSVMASICGPAECIYVRCKKHRTFWNAFFLTDVTTDSRTHISFGRLLSFQHVITNKQCLFHAITIMLYSKVAQ